MNTTELLMELRRLGAQCQADGDMLSLRAPRGAISPQLRQALAERKQDILQALRQGEGSAFFSYPLSHGQRALLYSHELVSGGYAYNVGFAGRIRSAVNIQALRDAFQVLLDRHAALRTTYSRRDGEPIQLVHRHLAVCFAEVEAAACTEEELLHQVRRAYQAPFDLEAGPILRVHVFRRAVRDNTLLFVVPHITIDGWSLWMFLDELRQTYQAMASGAAFSLPPLAYTYVDFVQWQAELLCSPAGERLWHYWQEKLATARTVLELPTDKPRPSLWRYDGDAHTLTLDPHLTRRMQAFATDHGMTLYTVLLAAFQVLLYRYTHQEDFVIGSPLLGRDRPETANVVGYFVNLVPIRAQLSASLTFQDLLTQVRQTMFEALDHQDFPFLLLLEKLAVRRDVSRPPLLQVCFGFQQLKQMTDMAEHLIVGRSGMTVDFGGLAIEPLPLGQIEGLLDLSLDAIETGASLLLLFKYNTDLFEAASITRLARQYVRLLEGIIAQPGCRIAQLPLLPDAELDHVLVKRPLQQGDYPRELVHRLFERQVERTPDAVAVACGDEQLTYRELQAQANRLAHHLMTDMGLQRGQRVGLMLGRSAYAIIAMLATLKAGGAYVPIDPAYPSERMRYILADSDAAILLTELRYLWQLEGFAGTLFAMDVQLELLETAELPSERQTGPEDLAYIMYTSGSTGMPKGVPVPHRSIARLVCGTNYIEVGPGDHILGLSSLPFDGSTFDIYAPLLHGGTCILAREEEVLDLHALHTLFQEQRIAACFLTTALFNTIVDNRLACFEGVQQVLFGGEKVSVRHVRAFVERYGPGKLVHVYGPTENTTFSTYYPVEAVPEDCLTIPIGQAIAHSQVWILDEHLHPVPVGVRGELHVGGAGLAHGYWRQAGLTAEKFIPHPWSDEAGSRLYKSGDLGRYLPDGAIAFLGRLDQQVKVRGFRIELGEIEAALLRHEAVANCAVVACEEGAEGQRLVAYLVGAEGQEVPGGDELRRHLGRSLPDYMLPMAFVQLTALPLTRNGKLDRKALPAPEQVGLGPRHAYIAPRNEIEARLAAIWSQALETECVGIQDNFFDLGGHSLKATRILSRIHKELQVHLSIPEIFHAPSVESLARVVLGKVPAGLAHIAPQMAQPHYPVSFAQRRLWIFDHVESARHVYNVTALFLVQGELDTTAFSKAFHALVARHEVLRTTFTTVDGEPRQVIHPLALCEIPVTDLSDMPESWERARNMACEDAMAPFDLEVGPLLRMHILHMAPAQYLLLFKMHHIIADGWALGILLRELAALYKSLKYGQDHGLLPLRIHYKDYAVWQHDRVSSGALVALRDYWHQQLLGPLPILHLATDFARPQHKTYSGKNIEFWLPEPMTHCLRTLTREAGGSLFMALITLVKVALYRTSGQPDLIIGVPAMGRDHVDLQDQLGCYLNVLALRDRFVGSKSFAATLRGVKQNVEEAFDHQFYPFDLLVEELGQGHDRSRSPIFDVMVVMQNTDHPEHFDLGEVKVQLLEPLYEHCLYDLVFDFSESHHAIRSIIRYNTDLFRHARITLLRDRILNLVEDLMQHPERSLDELSFQSKSEQTDAVDLTSRGFDF